MKTPKIRVRMPRSARTWAHGSTWKELLLTIIGTTISIILTFGTAACLDRCERVDDRKMSALMVMSNIESFSRNVDLMAQDIARCDSIGTWLLSLPQDRLNKISPEEASDIINEVIGSINFLSHDKTAESIFSSNIETWKNMQKFQFIDNVGSCFSEMNADENYWKEWVEGFEAAVNDVLEHPDEHPGERTVTKLLRNVVFRQKIESFHVRQSWLQYISAKYRYLNQRSARMMGIDYQDVEDFADERLKDVDINDIKPMQSDFRKSPLNVDSLTTLRPTIMHIDSVIHNK